MLTFYSLIKPLLHKNRASQSPPMHLRDFV